MAVSRTLVAILPATALALSAVGCNTPPSRSELERRDELERARDAYRPARKRPELPTLTAASPIEDFAEYAVRNSPRVEERFHAWERAVAEITVARSLPDPSLSLAIETGRMLEAVRAGFLGTYPGPGKLALAAEAQSSAAAARRHEFEQAALDAAFRARTVWLRAAWLASTLDVRRDLLGVVREIEALAAAQFRVGKVSQQDVLRAEIERDQLEVEIAALEDSRSLIVAEARSALGLAPPEPAPPLPTALTDTFPSLAQGELLERALGSNHELLALREEIREAESMLALARKSSTPDYMLGLSVDLVSPVMWMPEAGVTLPIYRDKIAALVSSALAARHAADARLSGATLDVVVRLADASFRYRDAGRRLALVREKLIPKSEAALDAARAAYQTGMSDMTDLLDAERSLLEFRVEEVTLRLERESARAEVSVVILGAR